MGEPPCNGWGDVLTVYSDSRWPERTGIGNVMAAMKRNAPHDVAVVDLPVSGEIGHPLSPLAIARALKRQQAHDGVFWSAGFVPPLTSLLPTVVTVHDLTHLHFYGRKRSLYYAVVLRPLYRRCNEIVCVSDYTRQEFLRWSGIAHERVSVVYNGVAPKFLDNQAKFPCDFQYVLYPGNRRSYKNLDRLLAAYASSRLPGMGIKLGLTGTASKAITALARRLGVENQLQFFGWVDEAQLPSLYRGALLVAFVSLYEGFGLPIVEGMASRVPVLTSNVSAMPEIAKDAALIVDPYDIPSMTSAMDRLAESSSLREDLVAKGVERVKAFDWRHSADQLWGVVRRAASQSSGVRIRAA